MKFGAYLSTHTREIWSDKYINYKGLKQLAKDMLSSPYAVYVPTKLSLSTDNFGTAGGSSGSGRVGVANRSDTTPQEKFFLALEQEMQRISEFVQGVAAGLRHTLAGLQVRINTADLSDGEVRQGLMEEAKQLGDEYLHLEKFVNVNYAGLQKILKQHDKLAPNAPCFPFYSAHISNQPWVQGGLQDLQVTLTGIFTSLHRSHGVVNTTMMQYSCEEHVRKFWVKKEHVAQVKHIILQHLPALELPQGHNTEDATYLNSLYLDSNSLELYHNLLYGRPYCSVVRLRWRGLAPPPTVQVQRKMLKEGWRPEAATLDCFPLKANKVADFLLGRWTFGDASKYLLQQQEMEQEQQHEQQVLQQMRRSTGFEASAAGHVPQTISRQTEAERIAKEYSLFKAYTEVQRLAESKSLQPMVLLRHQETVFEQPDGPMGKVKVELQENIQALLEYSYDGLLRLANGLWHQEHPTDRIELPYAVLKVNIPVAARSGAEGQPPLWMLPLIERGLLLEVHDFNKMAFGICGLLPDMVRAVPVWIDDPKVQKALYMNVLIREATGEASALGSQGMYGEAGEGEAGLQTRQSEPILDRSGSHRRGPEHAGGSPQLRQSSLPGPGHLPAPEGNGDMQSLLHLASIKVQSGVAGWQAKLAERSRTRETTYRSQVQFTDTNQFMQNERVFLKWLQLAITVGGLAVVMLGFAARAHSDPSELPTIHISEVTAFILIACAIYICAHGLAVFLWRGSKFYLHNPPRYDDTTGSLVLNLIVAMALFALFLLNIADLMEILGDDE